MLSLISIIQRNNTTQVGLAQMAPLFKELGANGVTEFANYQHK
jgi:hypothetical protein